MEAGEHFDENKWVIADEKDSPTYFSDTVAVEACLNERELSHSGQFTLWEQRPNVKDSSVLQGLFRVLVRPPKTHRVHLDLLWHANVAAIMFLNADGGEYRVLAESPITVTDETRRVLSFGEPTHLRLEYCLPKERAFETARRYMLQQKVPTGIRFKFVP